MLAMSVTDMGKNAFDCFERFFMSLNSDTLSKDTQGLEFLWAAALEVGGFIISFWCVH